MARTIRIGIYGPRNSGKTSYLAALFGKRAEGNTCLQLPDDETINILSKLWGQLEQGHKLEATAKGTPKIIPLSLTHEGTVSRVLTEDYAGALVQRNRTEQSDDASAGGTEETQEANGNSRKKAGDRDELAAGVFDWMKDSDALLLIIDADTLDHATKKELEERRNEIDLLITELQDGERLAKPLALVITKWDLYGEQPLMVEKEQARLDAFIQSHHLLGDVAKAVELSGKEFRVFPVSAFGGHDDKGYPPKDNVHPFNTLAPLAWCVERVRKLRRALRFRKCSYVALGLAIFITLFNLGVFGYENQLKRKMDTAVELQLPDEEIARRTIKHEDWQKQWRPWRIRLHVVSAPSVLLLFCLFILFKKKGNNE